jgi:acetyltransferase-like isoleucine patch superfamily enzyme
MKNLLNSGYYEENELKSFGFKFIGNNVKIAKTCNIINLENISIHNNVRIDAFSTIISSLEHEIIIGSNIHIGSYCYFSGNEGIIIEDFCNISQAVKIYTRNDDYSGESLTGAVIPIEFKKITKGKVILKKHVIVGSSSVIMPNLTLEEGAAIGALSFINKNIEAWKIYAGCPAKFIKNRSNKLLDLEKIYYENYFGRK